jgi:Mn2+/Fe2+ NRAMP family transporter
MDLSQRPRGQEGTPAASISPVAPPDSIPPPPATWKEKLAWLGPGVTWMAAGAGGAGELLFPPRIGSLYGYAFVWALLAAIFLKWAINREVGRFSVCTGSPLLEGFQHIPGPSNWAIWLIVLPQLVVAAAAIAGLAGSAATALTIFLPGPNKAWMAAVVLVTTAFLLWGQYSWLERLATVLALGLAVIGIITAVSVFPGADELLTGLKPSLPPDTDYQEVLPWLSFILAGAAGMTWYSYWIPAKGYGAASLHAASGKRVNAKALSEEQQNRLQGWIREMTLDNTLGVIGGFVIVSAFLILGAELLRPQDLVPEEQKVAAVLAAMMKEAWGRPGFWIMVIGVLVGFLATTLTNQDGWARLLANGTRILLQPLGGKGRWQQEAFLRKLFLVLLVGIIPIGVYAFFGEPVGLLQLAGVIEAVHIPVIVGLTLYMNCTLLPASLKPSLSSRVIVLIAMAFFIGFAGLYIYQRFL